LARPVVAYDAECGPCGTFKAVVELLDSKRVVRFASLRVAEGEGLLDPLDPATRYSSFHLISPSGRVESGPDALLPLAKTILPGGMWVFDALGSIPGVRAATRRGYATLSRLHGSGTCGASR
jgi:predicted DCC family thiol-disulfide oxidoreductase YuxK